MQPACHLPAIAKAPQVVDAKQAWERVIPHIAATSSLIDRINVKI